jgi:hypothetical protein
LREVLMSLYRFKRESVDPVWSADLLWRKMDGSAGFWAYLCAAAEHELRDLREFAKIMPDLPGVALRFKDLARGEIPDDAVAKLDRLDEGLGVMMREVLPHCLGA